jgi:hypothetical protein
MKQEFFMKVSCSVSERLKIKRFLLVRKLGIARSHISTVVDMHNQSALRKMVLPSKDFKVKKNTSNVKFIMCYYRSCQIKSLIMYNNSSGKQA